MKQWLQTLESWEIAAGKRLTCPRVIMSFFFSQSLLLILSLCLSLFLLYEAKTEEKLKNDSLRVAPIHLYQIKLFPHT